MTEETLARQRDDDEHEIDLDSEEEGDIEEAMQEALEAVEKASKGGKSIEDDAGESASRPQDRARPIEDPDVARLEEEIADLRDRSARTLADFDNYRKRIDREREEERKYAAFEVLRQFLDVVDNLERAIESDGQDEDLKLGVELILRQMRELMKNAGVQRVTAVGQEFDPRFHEAVTQHEDEEVAVPTVSGELQAGYLLHDRLLRPAVVHVAMPADAESNEETGETQ